MIPLDDPRRCLTCHGVHIGWRCPLEIEIAPITDEQARATVRALEIAASAKSPKERAEYRPKWTQSLGRSGN